MSWILPSMTRILLSMLLTSLSGIEFCARNFKVMDALNVRDFEISVKQRKIWLKTVSGISTSVLGSCNIYVMDFSTFVDKDACLECCEFTVHDTDFKIDDTDVKIHDTNDELHYTDIQIPTLMFQSMTQMLKSLTLTSKFSALQWITRAKTTG